jgi:hypothetical protein
MPYKVVEIIEKRVLLQMPFGVYTLQDMSDANDDYLKFLDRCSEKSGIILADISKMKSVENNLLKVRDISSSMFAHPNFLMTVGFGNRDKVVVNFIVNSLTVLFKVPAKSFMTEAETTKFIISQCPDLAESLPRALQEYYAQEG